MSFTKADLKALYRSGIIQGLTNQDGDNDPIDLADMLTEENFDMAITAYRHKKEAEVAARAAAGTVPDVRKKYEEWVKRGRQEGDPCHPLFLEVFEEKLK